MKKVIFVEPSPITLL